MSRSKGFTLVELLIVIALIGILSGLLLSIMSPTQQKNRAEDGVIRANIEEAVQGIEAYRAAEGTFPIDSNNDGNPVETTTPPDPLLVYIAGWPDNEPSGVYYKYHLDASGNDYGIVVALQSEVGKFLKYRSDWSPPRVQVCDVGEPENSGC